MSRTLIAILVLLSIAWAEQHVHAAQAADRPNVILILTDDQGYGDVGVHGNEQIRTPHIDRFTREGVDLTRFYCSPVCAPTRASLMTGRYYYRSGVIHTSRGGAKMAGENVTIAELLQQSGYKTGIFGKWHLGDTYPMRPQDQGFGESLVHKSGGIGQTPDRPNSYFDSRLWHNGEAVTEQGYCTDVFFRAATEFIEQNRDAPFFVYLPTNAPHTPLEIDAKYVTPYRTMGLADTTARVYGMVENIDDNLGKLLSRLDQLKLRENTIVLFIGDNGPQQKRYTAGLRGRKSWSYEGGIRVPCFVQWKGRYAGGRELDSIAAHIDLLPTLLDACGVKIPKNLDGTSIVPLLAGKTEADDERTLFFQCHRGLAPRPFQNCAVVTQQYKLVGYPGTFSKEDLDTSGEPQLELYDLTKDAAEQTDLADEHPDVVAKLRSAYQRWFEDVRATRRFRPGLVKIDGSRENPMTLCRYQDGNYRDGSPHGWTVEIVQGGRFALSVDRGELTGPGDVHVDWQGRTQTQSVAADANRALFDLPAGEGVIDIWFQQQGKERVVVSDNGIAGNVIVETVATPKKNARRPNVLFILTDDQRPDTIRALGNSHIQTPHLDALVRRGTSFTRAMCANPICTPSRAEILSGRSSFENGVLDFGGKIDPNLVLWPQAMQQAGYETWYVGKWHNDGRPPTRGYTDTLGLFTGGGSKWYKEQTDWKGQKVTGYRAWIFQSGDGKTKYPERGVGLTPDISEKFADAAIELIGRKTDKPFFLHLNFTAPHDPLFLTPGFEKTYDPKKIPLPKNFLPQHPFDHGNSKGRDEILLPFPRTPEIVQQTIAVYYSVISHLDLQVGRILRALEESGQAENTIVVFSSDHGLGVGSHGLRGKQNMYEHTINVPMIFAGPGIARGETKNAQVYLRDLYPTLCELSGVETPKTVRAKSFAGVLRGEIEEVHPFGVGYFRDKQRMIRTDRWKLISYPQIERMQLFDLENDPHELRDLSADPERQGVVANLRGKLEDWQRSVDDPLVRKQSKR
ncbi:MAG: hypothetical protein CMJ48_11725 [Planctomycetaceae bacterium]|nr:hypothetical protein [Planctomycetaceae bacterium]